MGPEPADGPGVPAHQGRQRRGLAGLVQLLRRGDHPGCLGLPVMREVSFVLRLLSRCQ